MKDCELMVETGIGGGSLSLFMDDVLVDQWVNNSGKSRSESIIEGIESLLEKNNLSKRHLKKINFSESPGSHTGLKVGHSIVKGLESALGLALNSRDLFQSISVNYPLFENARSILILPIGKNDFFVREYFGRRPISEIKRLTLKYFENRENIKFLQELIILLPFEQSGNLTETLNSITSELKIEDLGNNLSLFLK